VLFENTGVAALAVPLAADRLRHISLPSEARTPTPAEDVSVI
jgi:hypothetical protein